MDQDSRIRTGRISYVNVAPVYFGFDNGINAPGMEFITASPGVLNKMMARGELDISPVSSAAYAANYNKWLILPQLSISCSGPVMSVIFASCYPMEKLDGKRITLTADSATAAALCRMILASKGISPVFDTRNISDPADVSMSDAVLIIGDLALSCGWAERYPYVWDIGELWYKQTGLPFVFALWCVTKSYAKKFPIRVQRALDAFHKSLKAGLEHIKEIEKGAAMALGISHMQARKYYKSLGYGLGEKELNGLEQFFEGLYENGLIEERIKMEFWPQNIN